ncbi:disease resistance protein RGA2-like [Momordica charantia]|uniref:Disease resistance protein RGA2-like n=1 Tax=Momordica charantia TaxID=3673 RepID=A0A6J1CTI8_MOMCH|nr:disease resistance protein RGA2-like [Momordica charantia]
MLYNLQTLKLGRRFHLPKNLRKLVRLRHLNFSFLPNFPSQMPLHMSRLIHLQTLPEYIVGYGKGRKIEELGPLNDLKGSLRLFSLKRVRSKEEAIAAKLMGKKNLRKLTLNWSTNFFEKDSNHNDMEVLEGLQPHNNLQSLSILHFAGQVLPNGVFVENLVAIVLQKCSKCEMLPMLGQLPNLEDLKISHMSSVRSIDREFYGNYGSKQSVCFPKLRKLSFSFMEKLVQWVEVSNGIAFPHLESLSMDTCSKLRSVPDHFVSLRTLTIDGCEGLKKFPSKLECCISIASVKIFDCPNLRLNVHNMWNLKEIEIGGCMEEYDFSSLMHQSSVTNLCLTDTSRKAIQVPRQLQHLTTLKALTIKHFNGVEALPEWLEKLTNLETLEVSCCENLKRLPSRQAMLRVWGMKYPRHVEDSY